MGGIGSGRGLAWDKRTTLEEIIKIDIRYLKKQGILRPSLCGKLSWHCGGYDSGNINYCTHENGIELIYRYREGGGKWQNINQFIHYEETQCHYGGSRKWFVCPGCRKHVGVLGSLVGSFLCRHCNGLPYASQSESPIDRMIRKREKIGKRIFAQNGEHIYQRRKGLHKRSYERELNHYHELDWAVDHWISVKLNALDGLI